MPTLNTNITKIENRVLQATADYIAPVSRMMATGFTSQRLSIGQSAIAQVVDRSIAVEEEGCPAGGFNFYPDNDVSGRFHDVDVKMSHIIHDGFYLDKCVSEKGDINLQLLQEAAAEMGRGLIKRLNLSLYGGITAADFPTAFTVEAADFDHDSLIEVTDLFNEADVLDGGRYGFLNTRATGNLSRDLIVTGDDYFGQRIEGLSMQNKIRMYQNIEGIDAILEDNKIPNNGEGLIGAFFHPNAVRCVTGVPNTHEQIVTAFGFNDPGRVNIVTDPLTGLSLMFVTTMNPQNRRLYFWGGFILGKEYGGTFGDHDFSKRLIRIVDPTV